MSDKKFITLQESIEVPGWDPNDNTVLIRKRWFLQKHQYCYEEKVLGGNIVPDFCDLCDKDSKNIYYTVIIDDVKYYLPNDKIVVLKCAINPAYQNDREYLGNKDQDQTVDYEEACKNFLGVDLRANEVAQHNGEDYEFEVHETKPMEVYDNEYDPEKEKLEDCPKEDCLDDEGNRFSANSPFEEVD